MECPVCSCLNLKQIDKQPDLTLYHCQCCELHFWYPLGAQNREWYEDDAYYSIRNLLIPETLDAKYRLFLRANPVSRGELLDIGCGTGMFLAHCRAKGYKVTGIDFNKNFVATAKTAWKLNEVFPLSLEEYTNRYPDKKFDVITFFEVLEHQTDPKGFMKKVRNLLAQDGYVAMSVPNRQRWTRLPPMNDSPPNHFTRWDCDALSKFLLRCGFSIIELTEEPFTIRAARQVVTGWLNNTKNKILKVGLKVSSSREKGEKPTFIRKMFRFVFVMWRVLTFLPSLAVFIFAKWSAKKSFSIYCLAKMQVGFNDGSKEKV